LQVRAMDRQEARGESKAGVEECRRRLANPRLQQSGRHFSSSTIAAQIDPSKSVVLSRLKGASA
jgi:hypothetical protein